MGFIWHPYIPPKCSFTPLWLAFRRRLPTKVNLEFLDEGISRVCSLCGVGLETTSHLYFECTATGQIWRYIRAWMGVEAQLTTLDRALRWLRTYRKGDAAKKKMRKLAFACTTFMVWKVRNEVSFDHKPFDIMSIVCKIKVMVYTILGRLWPYACIDF
ncbi:unnamed protein product [Cuscuta campestris]|uniref:Reverse transcriptase zinc-binding domain-containing protein n=1 Tax=Cuscuta campestris TaxID=132261 RepID=A0A484L0K5_9ASTE|nr:unnamed protein product [Cuscuta campestris]